MRIVVYHCRNLRLFKNGERKTFVRARPDLRLVAVPCSGKVEAHHVLKTFATGVDGILVLACREDACQFVEGSKRSRKRIQFAQTWLEELNIEPDRVEYAHVKPAQVEDLERTLEEFTEKLKALGNSSPSLTP